MIPQVFNPYSGRCLDCPEMWCLEFHVKTETWQGWCHQLRSAVNGDDICHLPRTPPI